MRNAGFGMFVSVGLMASIATAEMKPFGAVVETRCGSYSKSNEVCLAQSLQSGKAVLVLRNVMRKTAKYFVADTVDMTPAGLLGVSKINYVTSVFDQESTKPYVIESVYELRTVRAVAPNAPIKSQLFKDGVAVSAEFDLKRRLVTQ